MSSTEVNALVNTIVVSLFVFLIGYILSRLVALRRDVPRLVSLLPADIQKIIQDAAAFGSTLVEQMDKNGELTAILNDLKPKAEQKMNLAVDYAVQYIEGIFAKNGFPVDIDQDALKAVIQKYIWDNPEIFPSSKTNL